MTDNQEEDNSPQGIYTFFQEDAIECAASYPEEIEEALCLWVNTKKNGEKEKSYNASLRAAMECALDRIREMAEARHHDNEKPCKLCDTLKDINKALVILSRLDGENNK